MAGLRTTLAALAQSRKLFSPLDTTQLGAERSRVEVEGVQEVTAFGANPGNLRMYKFAALDLAPDRPLVVVLHGCTQNAVDYVRDAGWLSLAQSAQFAVVAPQQQRTNNPNSCFNWFQGTDIQRDRGEVFSIWEMVEKTIIDHRIDRSRVYVTGLSAGGAMAAALLATYPDVFAGGSIVAGLPYRAAINVQQALAAMAQPQPVASHVLGDLVRSASLHRGPWPTVSIWHGSSDRTVVPANADALARQWCNVHGVDETRFRDDKVDGASRRVWRTANGPVAVERIVVDHLSHGTPIDPRGVSGAPLGHAAPFIIDAGISSARLMCLRWNLVATTEARSTQAIVTRSAPEHVQPEAAGVAHSALAVLRRVLPRRKTHDIASARTAPSADLTYADEWEQQSADEGVPASLYFGYASSGIGCDGGIKSKTMSRVFRVRPRQRLVYERRLHLHAGINIGTRAGFRVLVDGELVDEEVVTFANRLDHEWVARDIDLARFAGREVEVRFIVSADCNVCMEAFAKAWVRGMRSDVATESLAA